MHLIKAHIVWHIFTSLVLMVASCSIAREGKTRNIFLQIMSRDSKVSQNTNNKETVGENVIAYIHLCVIIALTKYYKNKI